MRDGRRRRVTRETAIDLAVALDAGRGSYGAPTGLRFFDHMLEAFCLYSGIAVTGEARSLDGIDHHIVEDVAIVLGGAIADALGDRAGIARFGTAHVAMDDALARAVIDCGGRAYARIDLPLGRERVEDLDTQLVAHFFRSLAQAMGATLHIDLLAGEDAHHEVEAAFKACALAFKQAWTATATVEALSTKGVLG
jgi:imidazoleglycerol-phosphate dehydratase